MSINKIRITRHQQNPTTDYQSLTVRKHPKN
nr:MAG TPA: hypothetical protein [Caudoviricetes sp.]